MPTFALTDDDVRIALHELGDPAGVPVLLIHGFSSNTRRNWVETGWSDVLADAGLRGIGMDLRGHGDSDHPSSGYAVETFVADLDAVMRQLGMDEPQGAIGYSMGSRLLWRFTSSRPSGLRALVLGGLPADDPFERFDGELALRALTGEAEPGEEERFVVELARTFPEHDPRALVRLATEVAETRFEPGSGAPSVPTLLMTGDRDTRAADSEELLAYLPRGSFEAIPGRTHVNAPTSGTFRRRAAAFLQEQLGA